MNYEKILQGDLRKAACEGDLETLENLIYQGVDVNSKNGINGWTALHWAARRNNNAAVRILLRSGADKSSLTNEGDLPSDLSNCKSIQSLLGGEISNKNRPPLSITPNYLKNPSLCLNPPSIGRSPVISSVVNSNKVLILKVRVAESSDPDFVEIELPKSELLFDKLVNVCCEELDIDQSTILKIRKLPNTILRNNKDVMRLQDFQELEIVIKNINPAI